MSTTTSAVSRLGEIECDNDLHAFLCGLEADSSLFQPEQLRPLWSSAFHGARLRQQGILWHDCSLDERFAMLYSALKALAGILSICSISAGAFSQCSVDVVVVKGRVENAPRKGIVRVQLVYPKQKQEMGESGDVTVEGGSFRIQIPFLTQSRAPGLFGIREKCDRKPKTVVVTLLKADQEGDHEYDRVSLDLDKDFKMADPSAYALRSEILLHGSPSTPPIR